MSVEWEWWGVQGVGSGEGVEWEWWGYRESGVVRLWSWSSECGVGVVGVQGVGSGEVVELE